MVWRKVAIGVLAFVFFAASASKVVDPVGVVRVLHFLTPGAAHHAWIGVVFPGVVAGMEVSLGLALLIPSMRRVGLAGAAVALAAFTVVLVVLAASRGAPGCGCLTILGERSGEREALAGIARNVGLLCLVVWVRHPPGKGQPTRPGQGVVAAPQAGSVRSGFTLVEMLVSISVISLLIALSLPSLGRAKAAGQLASQISMARQMDASLLMYTQDYQDGFPYFGTPGDPWGPIRIRGWEIRGMELSGPYFSWQRWLWLSAVMPEYFQAPLDAIRPEGQAIYFGQVLGWPEFIVAADFQVTSTLFAAPKFWSDDGGAAGADPRYLHQTRLSHVLFPSQKGLLGADLAGPSGWQVQPEMAVGLGDGSARAIAWREAQLAAPGVERPWGATGMVIDSTRDGLAGIDFP